MADRRMISKTFVDSDRMMEVSIKAKLLYYELIIHADDEGFVDGVRRLARYNDCGDEELQELVEGGFVVRFSSGVSVVMDWRLHNTIQADRRKETIYKNERKLVIIPPYPKDGGTDSGTDLRYKLKKDVVVNNGVVMLDKSLAFLVDTENKIVMDTEPMDTQNRLVEPREGNVKSNEAREVDISEGDNREGAGRERRGNRPIENGAQANVLIDMWNDDMTNQERMYDAEIPLSIQSEIRKAVVDVGFESLKKAVIQYRQDGNRLTKDSLPQLIERCKQNQEIELPFE